jgi:hypothetical protein
MEELGRIVRLQVQVAPLKRGDKPDRWYDTDRIRRVTSLAVTEDGVVGRVDGEDVVDVHHRDHPQSRHRGDNGISLCTTGHYRLMRERFGDHLVDGLAAENVLIEREGWLGLEDLADGVAVVAGEGRDRGELVLGSAVVAQPCVEFSRLAVGEEHAGSLREPLQALRDGVRGYYLTVEAGAGTVLREGDRLVRPLRL